MAKPVITDKPIIDQAEFNGVKIWRKEGGSIEVSDTNYPSMKAALQDIAAKAGIKLEEGWNTQYTGWYLIQQLKAIGKNGGTSTQAAAPQLRAALDGEKSIEKGTTSESVVECVSNKKKEATLVVVKEETVEDGRAETKTLSQKEAKQSASEVESPNSEEIQFESQAFEKYCLAHFDRNHDGILTLEDILNVKEISLSSTTMYNIQLDQELELGIIGWKGRSRQNCVQ